MRRAHAHIYTQSQFKELQLWTASLWWRGGVLDSVVGGTASNRGLSMCIRADAVSADNVGTFPEWKVRLLTSSAHTLLYMMSFLSAVIFWCHGDTRSDAFPNFRALFRLIWPQNLKVFEPDVLWGSSVGSAMTYGRRSNRVVMLSL